jgi:hypothetical protein
MPTLLHINHHDHRKKNECLTSQTTTITFCTDPQTQGLDPGRRIALIAGEKPEEDVWLRGVAASRTAVWCCTGEGMISLGGGGRRSLHHI